MQSKYVFILSIINKIKTLNYFDRQEFLSTLRKSNNISTPYYFDNRCMDWQQVRDMSSHGMEIGAHSFSHPSLAAISMDEAMQEIKKSKLDIENNIGKDCSYFSFPFGSRKDYNQKLINYVKECGFQACLLNMHGYNHIKKAAFSLKRIILDEKTNLNHLLG